LTTEAAALLVMKPSQLLKNLGMIRVSFENAVVSRLCAVIIFLLFVHMTDLEPDVFFGQGSWRRVDDIFEALQDS
jgi:hypothetical protein